MQRLPVAATIVLLMAGNVALAADQVAIGQFSQGTLDGWDSRAFNGETSYALSSDPDLGRQVLRADADGTASGRFRKITVDLTKTPYLHWSWKVDTVFAGIDETQKSGDDYPARIYVADERGLFGLTSISLNYVWASVHPVGSIWASPYTGQVRLLAVDSGKAKLETWVEHKRNVRDDLSRVFGEDITTLDGVALMTDADDHHGHATAAYGDIWFGAD